MPIPTLLNMTNEALDQEFDRLFREHSHLVYRTAYSVTGSPQDAEDVLQAIFLGFLRRGFPPGLSENPKGYLYRAAINLSLNTVRSRQRHIATSEAGRLNAHAETNRAEAEVDLERRLVNALAQLNPRAVEMLILRYEHNHTEAEIGKLLGTSRGVVAVTLYRARTRLKKLLRASGEMS